MPALDRHIFLLRENNVKNSYDVFPHSLSFHYFFIYNCCVLVLGKRTIALVTPVNDADEQTALTRSVGAKHPTHRDRSIQPRAWLLLLGF